MSNEPVFKTRRDTTNFPPDVSLVSEMPSRLRLSEPVNSPDPDMEPEAQFSDDEPRI